jgi:hypothetical protein
MQQLVQPSWWGPSDALLERLQRSEQVGNFHQPRLRRPVLVFALDFRRALG